MQQKRLFCSKNLCHEYLNGSDMYVVSFPDCVKSTLMTECYGPFHSLGSNGIGQEGCSALTAALQQCKELQFLR